jgi:ketopantoate reductase
MVGTGAVGTLIAKSLSDETGLFLDLRKHKVNSNRFTYNSIRVGAVESKQTFQRFAHEAIDFVIIAIKYSSSFISDLKEVALHLDDLESYKVMLVQNGYRHVEIAEEIWGIENVYWGTLWSLQATKTENLIATRNIAVPRLDLEDIEGIRSFGFANGNSWLDVSYRKNVIFQKMPRWLLYSTLCSYSRRDLGCILSEEFEQPSISLIEEINDVFADRLEEPFTYSTFVEETRHMNYNFKPSSLMDIERGRIPEVYWILLDFIQDGQDKGLRMNNSKFFANSIIRNLG